ncbi:transglutaminase domain-containing protein [Nanoarchaeota archaeon]
MEDIPEEVPEKWYKGPIKYILAVFLILLVVMWIVPEFAIKADPEPSMIPKPGDVFEFDGALSNKSYSLKEDYHELINAGDPVVKRTANKIASMSCESGEQVCQAKAMYYFVKRNFDYISDPIDLDYVERFEDFIISGGGDCESGTIVLANLMEAIGVDSEFVFTSNHAYLRIWLPEASNRYKQDDWIYLDWTCKGCNFGETSYKYADADKKFLDV